MPTITGRTFMNKRVRILQTFFAAMALVAVGSAGAARADGPKTETVTYSNGKDTLSGFVAAPTKPGKYPGLVVIHEWWGLNDWVKEQTTKLGDQGFVALAVDLYRGKVAADVSEAHELSRGLANDRAISDMNAAFAYLETRPDVDPRRIGAIGWCMGGGFALQLAIHQPRLRAVVVNYGALPTDPSDMSQIVAYVLGNFGADDKGITPDDVHAFEKTMRAQGKFVDLKIYEGAGHAFENPNNTNGYRPEAAADAWTRSVGFLTKALK
jgi:carboxymethylenebutenolidase